MLPACPWCPAVETITTMLPRVPRSTMRRATCLVQRKVPVRFTASCWFQRSSGISSTLRPPRRPALLTRTSTAPQLSRTRPTMASTCGSSVTSQLRPSASPPRRVIHSAHCRALSATTSTQTTRAPSSASPWAMPPPMFGLVPVTIATFPASLTRARPPPSLLRDAAAAARALIVTRRGDYNRRGGVGQIMRPTAHGLARPGAPVGRRAPSAHAAAQADETREQCPGQRDRHDDAGDDDGRLQLALGDVVQLQDG